MRPVSFSARIICLALCCYFWSGVSPVFGEAPQRLIDSMTVAIKQNPKDPRPYFKRAQSYVELHVSTPNLQRALIDIDKAISLAPKEFEYRLLKGQICATMHNKSQADASFADAARLARPRASDYTTIARFLRCSARPHEAIIFASKALKLEPSCIDARFERALLRRTIGEEHGALEDLGVIIKAKACGFWPYLARGEIYANRLENDKALADYSEGIKRFPDARQLYVARATLYQLMRLHQPAIKDLTVALKLYPDDATTRQLRAKHFMHIKRFKEARGDYDQIIDVLAEKIHLTGTELAECYRYRAECSLKLGEPESAIVDFSEAMKHDTTVKFASRILEARARAYFALKKYESCVADLTKAMSTPQDTGTQVRLLLARSKAYEALGKTKLAAKDRAIANNLTTKLF